MTGAPAFLLNIAIATGIYFAGHLLFISDTGIAGSVPSALIFAGVYAGYWLLVGWWKRQRAE